MNKALSLLASFIVLSVLTFGSFTPGQAASQTAIMPAGTVNIAHFFKPPPNMDAATAVKNFNMMVLTNGDYTYRDQMMASGYSSTIPEYFRSDGIQDPGSCTATPLNNQVAYKPGDFCSISQNHPDWFLLDSAGRRITVTSGGQYYRMDPSNAGWREFFLSRVIESQNQYGWNALFLDNVEGGLGKYYDTKPAKYPDNASYQTAVAGFLQYLHANFAQKYGRPIIGNIVARADDQVWFTYLQYLEGAMQERFAVGWNETDYLSASKWQHDLDFMEQTEANGKYIILVSPGNQSDLNRQNFAFASYLLINNGKAAFRYSTDDAYRDVWLYNNYKINLGSPMGQRYQVGTTWQRNFTKGTVVVDPNNHTASIQLKAPDPVGVGTYDDSHGNWTYNGPSWLVTGGDSFTNNSVHYTSGLGDSASFVFKGTQFKLTYTQATNRGNIGIYVDGSQIATLNAYGPLQFRKTYMSPVLQSGAHTVEFRNAGGGGPYIDIDGIQILNSSAPGEGSYDDSQANWTYSGSSWLVTGGDSFTNNSVHYTLGLGDFASFAFNGTQFKLTYTQATNRGNIGIYLDGSQIATLNAYGPLVFRKSYSSPTFPGGLHVVQFKNIGGSGPYIDIDGIQILNTSAPGAGSYDDAHANWIYTGPSWLVTGGDPFTNNSVHYTNGPGDSAYFTFNGSQFILTYTQATNRGNTDIFIDGTHIDTLNSYGPLVFRKTYTSPTFTSGTHVVLFRNAGGNGPYIDIDGIQIK